MDEPAVNYYGVEYCEKVDTYATENGLEQQVAAEIVHEEES